MEKIYNTTHAIAPRSQTSDEKYIPEEYREFAKGMEDQFVNHMLGEMRKTIDRADEQSQTDEIYQGLLDNERSKIITNHEGGVGIQKMILDQIYPERFRNKQAYEAFLNQRVVINNDNRVKMHKDVTTNVPNAINSYRQGDKK